MSLVAIVSLGGAFVPGGFHALWVDAARYADAAQRTDGLQPEPALPEVRAPLSGCRSEAERWWSIALSNRRSDVVQ
jgi:hypothetical protein